MLANYSSQQCDDPTADSQLSGAWWMLMSVIVTLSNTAASARPKITIKPRRFRED